MTTPLLDGAPPKTADAARVLVAVDDPETRALISRSLEAHYFIEAVSDAQAASGSLGRRAPDLVLIERVMPRLDGLGLLREIRSGTSTSGIAVILLSAPDEEDWRVEGLRAGASDYLIKPFGARELLARVDLQLKMARLRTEAASREQELRVHAEKSRDALRASEERFRTFVRQSRDGIIIIDSQGTIVEWNEGEEQLAGIPRSEALNRPIWELQHRLAPDERRTPEFVRVAREKALAGLKEGVDLRRAIEEEIQRPDGTRRTVQSILFAIRSDGELLAGGISRDITDRKRMEQEIADANRRKDEFLALLSHELRNPLAPIRSSLHVLAHTEPGREQARRMQAIIERQVQHLTRLVDDLLDVTRISRGKIQLQRERVELGELVRRTVEDHRSTFTESGVDLEGRTALRPMWLNVDPTRIAQIIGNLLTNAAKFTPRGGRVDVALEQEGADGVLRVRDNGVGIAREMQDRLFQPFMQADRTLDRARGGLGLGLALVKGLTEIHGGSVSAKSEGPGRGAEFIVRLPLEAPAEKPVAEEEGKRPARRFRVLVIDDNADAADSFKEALELDGHEVEVAYDGPDALVKARVFQPEVVLCDIGLPGMDGYDVARAFRADDALKGSFLVALTGYALPEDVQRAHEAGFDRHLAKPPSFEKLGEVLAEAKQRPRARA